MRTTRLRLLPSTQRLMYCCSSRLFGSSFPPKKFSPQVWRKVCLSVLTTEDSKTLSQTLSAYRSVVHLKKKKCSYKVKAKKKNPGQMC